ncbi:MAG: alanine racemase, partial [Candidatus Omnitrophica bacterium]|nr:alanine racemase [Candidatus Omnitrophota bacterium]
MADAVQPAGTGFAVDASAGTGKAHGYRPTRAEINLAALSENYRQFRKLLPPGVRVLVTVKADAYGHGLIPVAQRLCACGVDFLGVASIDEGIRLRQAGIDVPVLILGLILKENVRPVIDYDLYATVCEDTLAAELDRQAHRAGKVAGVHVKVDTGMGRIGLMPQDARSFIRKVSRLSSLRLDGVFTHFPCADSDDVFTRRQIASFNLLLESLRAEGISVPLVHAANSCAAIDYASSRFTMVRPGLIIYGLSPRRDIGLRVRPVLSLKTRVIFSKRLPRGTGISYGHTYVTKKSSTVITLPIGYGDGYPRNLSNKAPVLLHGKRFRVSGRICMDQMMVDVGDEPVAAGDEVVLIGTQLGERITAGELAGLADTISYEIVC